MKLKLVILAAAGILSTSAYADCWRLPNGQIIQTSANSSPPVRGAQRIACPPPSLSLPKPNVRQQEQQQRPQLGITAFDRQPDSRECTEFARSLVRRLPGNLYSFADKRAIINDRTPRVGSVAIIEVPSGQFAPYGHVAVVEEVTSNSITVAESHFGGAFSERRRAVGRDLADAEAQLRIVGYFRP
jgi:hypothetical protein